MEIHLFMEHLNQLLESTGENQWPDEINALYQMHIDNGPPDADTRLAASVVSAVHTIIRRHGQTLAALEHKRRLKAVKGVINTLSFSELEAAVHICKKLNGGEGLLVAGHIADTLGFTRSVVTGALRKLEGAGAVETRSLGMKGMFIRIKDTLLAEELNKL
jgi:transcriptional pleiotropic repressor